MSNYLAIATVTEALRQLAQEGAREAGFAGADAVVLRPPASVTSWSSYRVSQHVRRVVSLSNYAQCPVAECQPSQPAQRRHTGSAHALGI